MSPQNLHDSPHALRALVALFRSRTIYCLHRRDAIRKSASDVATVECVRLKDFVGGGSEETEKTHNLIGTVLGG
jgi:hypothetical protein